MRTAIYFMCFVLTTSAAAQDAEAVIQSDEVNLWQSRSTDARHRLLSADEASGFKSRAEAEKEKHFEWIQQIMANQKTQQGGEVNHAEGVILFVSFSMPDPLLVSLSEQAKAYKIPLVIRGLVGNDFKLTLKRIQSLKTYAESRGKAFHGVVINPVWFEQFEIDTVPALVVTKRPSGCALQKVCANQPFDVIYGNTSIRQGLEIFEEKSEAFGLIAADLLRGENNA